MVSGGASDRITSRAPRSGTIGSSSRSWKKRPPSSTSRAADSRVPWCTPTRAPPSGRSVHVSAASTR
jgi:hypothetical protein